MAILYQVTATAGKYTTRTAAKNPATSIWAWSWKRKEWADVETGSHADWLGRLEPT